MSAVNPVSDQTLIVDSTAGGVSLTIPTNAKRCYIEIHTSSIYYTFDGGTPASGNGGRADPGDIIDLMGTDDKDDMRKAMADWRGLEQSSTDALAIIHYFE
jgi:hypothetical protein